MREIRTHGLMKGGAGGNVEAWALLYEKLLMTIGAAVFADEDWF